MYMYMYKKVHKHTNFLKFYVCCDDSWDAPRGTIFGDDFGVKKKTKKEIPHQWSFPGKIQ